MTLLTPRELQVARLLADGLKDWQAARRLAISVSTVEKHVRHAYAKTGTGCRARLVLWVREHDSRITNPDATDEHNRSTDGGNR